MDFRIGPVSSVWTKTADNIEKPQRSASHEETKKKHAAFSKPRPSILRPQWWPEGPQWASNLQSAHSPCPPPWARTRWDCFMAWMPQVYPVSTDGTQARSLHSEMTFEINFRGGGAVARGARLEHWPDNN
ncbi:hypothetical protein ACJJTC_008274 [Scirpophaga incertulas]